MDGVRTFDEGLKGWDHPRVLERAAKETRVVITHDVNTMSAFAHDRLAEGLPVAGVVIVPASPPIGQAIEETRLVAECLDATDCEGQVF